MKSRLLYTSIFGKPAWCQIEILTAADGGQTLVAYDVTDPLLHARVSDNVYQILEAIRETPEIDLKPGAAVVTVLPWDMFWDEADIYTLHATTPDGGLQIPDQTRPMLPNEVKFLNEERL